MPNTRELKQPTNRKSPRVRASSPESRQLSMRELIINEANKMSGGKTRAQRVAAALLSLAESAEIPVQSRITAIGMILDRIDGKPLQQSITATVQLDPATRMRQVIEQARELLGVEVIPIPPDGYVGSGVDPVATVNGSQSDPHYQPNNSDSVKNDAVAPPYGDNASPHRPDAGDAVTYQPTVNGSQSTPPPRSPHPLPSPDAQMLAVALPCGPAGGAEVTNDSQVDPLLRDGTALRADSGSLPSLSPSPSFNLPHGDKAGSQAGSIGSNTGSGDSSIESHLSGGVSSSIGMGSHDPDAVDDAMTDRVDTGDLLDQTVGSIRQRLANLDMTKLEDGTDVVAIPGYEGKALSKSELLKNNVRKGKANKKAREERIMRMVAMAKLKK